jgi:hypothetical protein
MAIYPTKLKLVNSPAAFSPIISPAIKDAKPVANCCIAELKLKKLPLFSGRAVPVIIAAAGTYRPLEVTKNKVDTNNT